MQKNLKSKVLLTLLAASVFYIPSPVFAENLIGDGSATVSAGDNYENVYGKEGTNDSPEASGATVNMTGGTVTNILAGGYSYSTTIDTSQPTGITENNIVKISGDSVINRAYGGYGSLMSNYNEIHISGNSKANYVYGGSAFADYGSSATGNKVYLSENASAYQVYGGNAGSIPTDDTLVGNYNNYIELSGNASAIQVCGGVGISDNNTITIKDNAEVSVIYGGYTQIDKSTITNNNINVLGGTVESIYGGVGTDDVTGNKIYIANAKITNAVVGAYYWSDDSNNNPNISYNTITISENADISKAAILGYYNDTNNSNINVENNDLTINNWSGDTLAIYNVNNINFENIAWKNGGTVLNITANDEPDVLANTNININSINFAGGSTIQQGDTMTFIAGDDLGIGEGTGVVTCSAAAFTSGVALEGTGSVYVDESGHLVFSTENVQVSKQTNLLAQTRAASAAFVNQGTDLINDSLDVLGRDGTYGVKTFAAVQGNRSTYSVADDLKINGWSVIAGFGAENEHKGGDFAWGVFYENGSGNYRTYNTFNNEFFRGDGSMVYNGGGIAARYENAKGVYTEGSLRAGMLKTEMDNALRDSSGASYGYDSESTYYGAHVGVGQIFEIGENTDLDVYGKFFHTYVEGDSFSVGSDKFDFDSVTSDRLRVGARVTKQQAKVNTYYGLAYEYEFNGDADMTAQGIRAERQSFGGGSGIAELGFNYQPGNDSPWNFDLNLRGYVGERQGGSFNVQATYTF